MPRQRLNALNHLSSTCAVLLTSEHGGIFLAWEVVTDAGE